MSLRINMLAKRLVIAATCALAACSTAQPVQPGFLRAPQPLQVACRDAAQHLDFVVACPQLLPPVVTLPDCPPPVAASPDATACVAGTGFLYVVVAMPAGDVSIPTAEDGSVHVLYASSREEAPACPEVGWSALPPELPENAALLRCGTDWPGHHSGHLLIAWSAGGSWHVVSVHGDGPDAERLVAKLAGAVRLVSP